MKSIFDSGFVSKREMALRYMDIFWSLGVENNRKNGNILSNVSVNNGMMSSPRLVVF